MKNTYDFNQRKNKKSNELLLFNLGHQHTETINKSLKTLEDKYANLEIPDELDAWFDHYQNDLRKDVLKARRRGQSKDYATRIAVAFIAFLLLNGLAASQSQAYHSLIRNMILDVKSNFSLFSNETSEVSIEGMPLTENWNGYYYPTYMPDDFILKSISDDSDFKVISFEDYAQNTLFIQQTYTPIQHQLDTEGSQTIHLDINGNPGVLVVKDDISTLTWNIDDLNIIITGKIDNRSITKIAEKMVEKN